MTTPWHEDDQFWAELEPLMFRSGRFTSAVGEVDAIIGLAQLESGARVLDMPAGPGRHAVELARRGFRVTGVDRTERYLERARAEASQRGVEVELVRADMREFVRDGAFDAVLDLNTSLGYFADPADTARVLANLRRSLAPGGVAVVETQSREIVARDFQPRRWVEVDGVLLLEERSLLDGWARLASRWIVVRDTTRSEHMVEMWLYSGTELRAMLHAAGFGSVELYGSYAGAPYDHAAGQLVLVARP